MREVSGLAEILCIHLLKIRVGLKVSVVRSPENPNNQTKTKAIESEFRLASCYIFLQKPKWMPQILITLHYLPFQETMSKDPPSVYKGHVHVFPEMETTWIKLGDITPILWSISLYLVVYEMQNGMTNEVWHSKSTLK